MKKENAKINVMLLIYSLEIGGAEKVVSNLANYLDQNKFNVIVCGFKGGLLENELKRNNISYVIIGKKGRLDYAFPFKLYKTLRKSNIHILHTHLFSPNIWGRLIGRIAGIPIIISTEHSMVYHKNVYHQFIDRLTYRLSNIIVAVSDTVKESHIQKENLSSNHFKTIHNGIDIATVNKTTITEDQKIQLKNSLNIKKEDTVLLSVGRLNLAKGYEYLLRAAPLILKEVKNIKVLIVGSGPLLQELKKLAQNLNISESIIFAGYRNDVYNLITISDICVISSIREGLSLSLLEYLAFGKPVISTDVGANAEVIENERSGLIIPPKEPLSIAKAIIRLLQDISLAKNIGFSGRSRVEEHFTVNKMVSKYETLYISLINQCS